MQILRQFLPFFIITSQSLLFCWRKIHKITWMIFFPPIGLVCSQKKLNIQKNSIQYMTAETPVLSSFFNTVKSINTANSKKKKKHKATQQEGNRNALERHFAVHGFDFLICGVAQMLRTSKGSCWSCFSLPPPSTSCFFDFKRCPSILRHPQIKRRGVCVLCFLSPKP